MLLPLHDVNPRTRAPVVTIFFIVLNVVAFAYEMSLGPALESFVMRAGVLPAELVRLTDLGVRNVVPPPLTIFTSMFLHGGIAHLVGNMWFLWIFGDNVEETIGRARYFFFYLGAGAAAAIGQALVTPNSMLPMVGASGAVAGVLGAYVVLFPGARIVSLLFLFIFVQRILVPAWVFLGLWFVGQFFIDPNSRVAWAAHVAGFAGGFLFMLLAGRSRRRPRPVRER